MVKPFIPKENFEIPDSYKLTVYFVGESTPKIFNLVNHNIVNTVVDKNGIAGVTSSPYLEYTSVENDIIGFIPISSIKYIELDKSFIKLKELQRKKHDSK